MNAEQRLNKILQDAKNRVYKQRDKDPEKYKEYQRNLMKERRAKNKVEENKKNTEYQRKYRANLKEEVGKIKEQNKSLNTLSNAIKSRKARKELEGLKQEKTTKTLLDSIVKDALLTATTATAKKGRPRKLEGEPKKVYNLRNRKV